MCSLPSTSQMRTNTLLYKSICINHYEKQVKRLNKFIPLYNMSRLALEVLLSIAHILTRTKYNSYSI